MYVTNLFLESCKHVELGLHPSYFLFSVHPWVAVYIFSGHSLGGQKIVQSAVAIAF